ncbi:hypothetical protein KC332_g8844 [Hortaea werneckii]|uniref:Uncharacterized protein n=2 Tax=Hortaea werneckii TaxID=91943 RepID=A0A3M7I2Z3_HORWE|nr:hypothetical protein KC358_g8666 [Hortaea werneckii]OTA32986.1 hypothetical protein BTJ68_07199 [Hortaea werneckii EXF-2000]KAI6828033.1 hypothetical protein KC350_g8188 [Hortaea werneckii]KAI6925074.1 hypothetical protein KC348_g9061 [Hortaea werneckii]KAI6933096.1 hypothetical protein KC341_g8534 [Hortaea werneckii]
MDSSKTGELITQLTVGFDALQEEYRDLHGKYSGLERKLHTAREQYNALAKLLPTDRVATPPLSLSSSPRQQGTEPANTQSIAEILRHQQSTRMSDAAEKVQAAVDAAQVLQSSPPQKAEAANEGVKIWSGPSADKPSKPPSSSVLPSISESPLEQDFTIEGKPSRLGCPFASMAGKKLSSHAASVLSRYNTRESSGAPGTSSAAMSSADVSVSRVNGKASWSRRESRRESFRDPIKAEICGMSDHNEEQHESAASTQGKEAGPSTSSTHAVADAAPASQTAATADHASATENAEVGVCPIRFLDQHSPEEVATYFEKHKHELPRSHEICVRRYQSNEDQIRELDAKYGNIVSMIQGLGKKHKDYLPNEPDPEAEDIEGEEVFEEAKDNEKVRKWASSVSAQAPQATMQEDGPEAGEEEEEERVQHFERPLRDIRVGESPSRPWGISVPVKYLEQSDGDAESNASSRPAQISAGVSPAPQKADDKLKTEAPAERPAGRCPFGFDKQPPTQQSHSAMPRPPLVQMETSQTVRKDNTDARVPTASAPQQEQKVDRATFFAGPPPRTAADGTSKATADPAARSRKEEEPRMIFTGPVFFGYSADDAAKILRESGLGAQHSSPRHV